MKTVNVATLKGSLSRYLREVEKGQELIVTSHKRSVAIILPVDAPSLQPIEPSKPPSVLRKLKRIGRKRSVSAVDSLLEDRRRR